MMIFDWTDKVFNAESLFKSSRTASMTSRAVKCSSEVTMTVD